MPTGYTADVVDGKVADFRTFALRCARAFGACVLQRDDPMNDEPKHREAYAYSDKIESARAELEALLKMDDAALEAAAVAEYEAAVRSHAEREARRRKENDRIDSMTYQVKRWTPPSKDHAQLREFMLEQLQISRNDYRSEPPKRLTGAEWKAAQRGDLERRVAYYTQAEIEEQARVKGANEWIDALYASLPPAPEPVLA